MSNINDFEIKGSRLCNYTGPGGDVVIPDGVTEIAVGAFQWAKITSVTIPEGVTLIDNSAFNWCKDLTTVVLPQSLTHIHGFAFRGCAALTDIVLPEGLQVLHGGAFQYCSSLAHIRIPAGLKEVPGYTFGGCKELVDLELTQGLKTIGSYAFAECMALKSVNIPDTVETIEKGAFSNCPKLQGVQIPDSVETIGESAFWGCDGMADKDGMVIVRGVLHHCKSALKQAVVPASVTAICPRAFGDNKNLEKVVLPEGLTEIPIHAFTNSVKLKEVVIPDSVTTIGKSAFEGCNALKTIDLPKGLEAISENMFKASGLTEIVIPEGVNIINGGAFRDCKKLTKVALPSSLIHILVGDYHTGGAFSGCDGLTEITGGDPELKIPKDTFGWKLPKGLEKNAEALIFKLADPAALDYVIKGNAFTSLSRETQVTLMLTKQGKTLLKEYNNKRIDWGKVAEEILSRIHDKYTAKECNAVATLMVACCDRFNEERVQALYNALEPLKNSTKAKKTIADCTALSKKLKLEAKVDDKLTGLTKLVAEKLLAAGKTQKELEAHMKNLYGITAKDLPALKDTKGKKVDPVVFVWLMTAHEEMEKNCYNPGVTASYKAPGIRPEAEPILAELDQKVFLDALQTIGNKNLGLTGRSKKMFLAYPICRYADETLMEELTKTAPKWRSSVSGNDAPPLLAFRRANAYSNTRAAMMFADKYKELDHYAKLRGTDADTLRDQNLSDVGIDANGGKTYDLGNQTVVARLQNDLSFLVELPTGKTAKSLPKKGADEALYAAANADFSEMKKAVKKILKNRNTVLFQDFLEGKERTADGWKAAYLDNALLRRAAKLLVWSQGGKTFTVTDAGLCHADGTAYALTDKKVALAHPMDMEKDDLKAWQQYFTRSSLKQPFEQVWEPVVDPGTITADRYKGCMIPFYRFNGQSKHGIHVEDYDFHAEICIYFDDCDATIDRIDWARHDISPDHNFEVTSFSYKKYTRKVNHIAAYLDKVTVFGRIAKDDVTIADRLENFTLAQITECLSIAQVNKAVNVTALLLEFKNTHFGDFDPMDEFTLDL